MHICVGSLQVLRVLLLPQPLDRRHHHCHDGLWMPAHVTRLRPLICLFLLDGDKTKQQNKSVGVVYLFIYFAPSKVASCPGILFTVACLASRHLWALAIFRAGYFSAKQGV